MSDKEALAGKVLKATMVEMILAFEKRLEVLEKKLEGVDPSACLVNKVKIQLSMTKEIRELREQIAELKEKYKLLEKSFKGNTNTDVDSHVKLANEIAELKEPIELLKKFQQGYIDRIINLEEVLRDVNNSLISLCEILDTKWNDPIDAIPLLAEWGHAEKTFLMKNNEKLDVGSASARESLDRQTVKRCADCRKYKTEDCPPWPTKGPDHWCTQFEPKDSKGDKQIAKEYLEYMASGGEKESAGHVNDIARVGTLKDDSKLPEPYPNPEDCLVCRGEVPSNEEEYKDAILYHKLRCIPTEPEKKALYYWDDMKSLIEKAEHKLIEEFDDDLEQMHDWVEGGGMNGNMIMDAIRRKQEKWQGRIK